MKTLQVLESANIFPWVLFPLAITIHNLEEAFWLPKWTENNKLIRRPIGSREFLFAILFITIFAYLSTFFTIIFPSSCLWKHIFYGFLGAMILNIIFSHLLTSIILRKYSPGLFTGVLIVFPTNSSILYQSFTSRNLGWLEFILSSIVVSAVILFLLPLLFKIGRKVSGQRKM
jgi:hypothetical protein